MDDLGSIIGSVTGVAALIISILSYRYAKKVNDQTIHLKFDELVNDITIQLESLPVRMKEVDRSKTFNLAAKGQFLSGVTVAWGESLNGLRERVESHQKEFDAILKEERDKVLQMRQLDRLKKVLDKHFNWLDDNLKEDREEALIRLQKLI